MKLVISIMGLSSVQVMFFVITGFVECAGMGVGSRTETDIREHSGNNKTSREGDVKIYNENDTYVIQAGTGVTDKSNATSVTERLISATPHAPEEGLPIPILVASPAVAVSIIIFICVAYKLHTKQLDDQAKQLAIQVAAGTVQYPSPRLPIRSSPGGTSERLLPMIQANSLRVLCHSETDLHGGIAIGGARKKSLRSPSPTSQILLTPNFGDKRGSSWSALSDQEIVNHSPRRHSTFLL